MDKQSYLRSKILLEHFQKMMLQNSLSKDVETGLTSLSTISSKVAQAPDDVSFQDRYSGSLLESDLRRFTKPFIHMDRSAQKQLADALQSTVDSLAQFFRCEAAEQENAQKLVDEVQLQLDRIAALHREVQAHQQLIQKSMEEIDEIHPKLQADLFNALENFPSVVLNSQRASHELIAVSIETLLLKLNVIRARTRQSLYGHTTATDPNLTLGDALTNLHDKLRQNNSKLIREEEELDRRLGEYRTMLQMLDGRGESFTQIVEDWTKVKKGTEECRQDLNRLGWRGTRKT